jgi:hypothetical protein
MKFSTRMFCAVAMFATTLAMSFTAGAGIQSSEQLVTAPGTNAVSEKAGPVVDPTLTVDFLKEPSEPGRPFLVIGYYDLSRGLLAGYQASNGRRILFKAAWVPNGSVLVSATHIDPQTGRPYSFYGPRTPDGSKASLRMELAGVDAVAYFRAKRNEAPGRRHDPVGDFIESDSGEAYFEGVPALFAVLESLDGDPKLAALPAQFGALLTLLQISSSKISGFKQADAVLGSSHANVLRSECQGKCDFAGKGFIVHKNGLFDSTSKRQASFAKMIQGAGNGPFGLRLKNGNGVCDSPGDCFGRCGQGCDGQSWMGQVYTGACWAHDMCVCMWGDAACVFFDSSNPPGGYCPGCGDLYDAALSWIWEVVQIVIDWLTGASSSSGSGDYPDVCYQ